MNPVVAPPAKPVRVAAPPPDSPAAALRKVVLVERLSYLLALLPFLADSIVGGRLPGPAGLIADSGLAAVIVGLILIMRSTRRLTERIDTLRKTMNEAVIHDLKNPMTAVMGCLSCLLESELNQEKRNKLINIALHSCRAQMALLETLVDTNRLEHGELRIRREELDAGKLLGDSLEGVRGTASYLGVTLVEDLSPSFPRVLSVDPDLFPRVIQNLLNNALKYTQGGGTVSLRAFLEGTAAMIEIRDTGIGIGADHIGRLFEKYYRVEGGDQTSRRGSGLGLYFCRLVIEAHGGKIRVISGLGTGTSITLELRNPGGG